MSLLNVSNLSKIEDGRYVLKDIGCTQAALQNLALAGATGSGKTTLLKTIAGLIEPTTGAVYFKGEKIKGPTEKLLPGHPSIAYLSQHFELRNHYRVQELLDMAKKVVDEEADLIYQVCRIHHLLKRRTNQLSGGEKQRIALARLLVASPELLLLDEPYSNLDPFHKNILKTVVQDLSKELQITCILVSHDPQDTLSWADEILVLNNGEKVQQGSPQQVYRSPANEYTAALFGKYTVLTPALAIAFAQYADVEMQDIGRFVRPEEFRLTAEGEGVKTVVERLRFMGGNQEIDLTVAGSKITMLTSCATVHQGQQVHVSL
jgi:ABC-type sugar transport system ATPase subunit